MARLYRFNFSALTKPKIGFALFAVSVGFGLNAAHAVSLHNTPENGYENTVDREKETVFDYRPIAPVLHTLPNGLRLAILPDHRAPVVSHTVWYRVGGSDEPAGQSGVAHFLEHLMFRGTETLAPGEFSKRIAAIGGEDNAFTTRDFTAYYQNVSVENLETVMAMEADRMRNLKLTDSDVARERDVVLEERKMRVDNTPVAKIIEEMNAVLYRNHPYGSPVIGWEHEIKALNSQTARDFYQQYYAPNNALVTVVGDVDPKRVIELAEKTYGKNKANLKLTRTPRPTEPPQTSARTVTLKDEKTENPTLYFMFQGYSELNEPAKNAALTVAMQAFGGGASSYLYRELAEKKRIALSAGAQAGDYSVDPGAVYVLALPAPGVSLETLEKAVKETRNRFIKEGFTDAAILRAKKNLVADFITVTDSRGTLANLWGETLLLSGKPDRALNYPRTVQNVRTEDAKAAFQEIMNDDRGVIGYLLPSDTKAAHEKP